MGMATLQRYLEKSNEKLNIKSVSLLAWSDKSELLFAIAVIFDDIAAAFDSCICGIYFLIS